MGARKSKEEAVRLLWTPKEISEALTSMQQTLLIPQVAVTL